MAVGNGERIFLKPSNTKTGARALRRRAGHRGPLLTPVAAPKKHEQKKDTFWDALGRFFVELFD